MDYVLAGETDKITDDLLEGVSVSDNYTKDAFILCIKKSRVDKKYVGRNLWIAFTDRETNEICIYEHDMALEIFENSKSSTTKTWKLTGLYSGRSLHKQFNEIILRLPLN